MVSIAVHTSFPHISGTGICPLFTSAAVFVYLLMVVNYQNFGDPFVVILALPATFCGIVTMLYITDTTLSVLANGRDHGGRRRFGELDPARDFRARTATLRHERVQCSDLGGTHADPSGAVDRCRDDRRYDPDGDRRSREEQNAALARAVIGGLLFATPTTLIIVPYLFAMLRKRNDGKPAHGVFVEEPR